MTDKPSPAEPLLIMSISVASGLASVREDMLRRLLDACYRARRKKPACMDLLVTTDIEMARMNRRHLGRDNATDVLAFDDGEMEDGRIRLGDIAIGAETAEREAGKRGIAFEDELAFYALHGLLHLLGMRDDTDAERADMHREQVKAMRTFGLKVDETTMQVWTRSGETNE